MDFPFDQLSPLQRTVVAECLRAAIDGPFFPDWEFETLFGVSRDTVRSVADDWERHVFKEPDSGIAVIGALNNLLGYPHGEEDEWRKRISASPEEVRSTLRQLVELGL